MIETRQFVYEILRAFFASHPWLVAFNCAFLLLVPIGAVWVPRLYGRVVDIVQKGGGVMDSSLLHAIVWLFVVMILLNIGNMIGDWHDTWLGTELLSHIRNVMYERLLMKIQGGEELPTGQLVSRFAKIPMVFMRIFERLQMTIVPSVLVMIGSSIYVTVSVDRKLGLTLCAMTAVVLYLLVQSPTSCQRFTTTTEHHLIDIYDNIDDTLRNSTAVAERRQQKYEARRLEDKERLFREMQHRSHVCSMRVKTVILPITVAVLVVFAMNTYAAARSKKLEVAAFVTGFVIVTQMISTTNNMTDTVKDFTFAWAALDIAKEDFGPMLGLAEGPRDSEKIAMRDDDVKCIEADSISFKYPGTDKITFTDLSFKICRGERVAIKGPIGCGKTTVLKMIVGFVRPNTGRLTINDVEATSIDPRWLKTNVAYVPQTPSLFDRTLYENIVYGASPVPSKRVVHDMMKRLGIEDIVSNKPEGLDFKVGKGGSKLSGGQRQLVYCMRVLLNDPQIVLLDEPTASLDARSKTKLVRLLDELIDKDKIVVMVTHDDYLASKASRALRIA